MEALSDFEVTVYKLGSHASIEWFWSNCLETMIIWKHWVILK